MKVSIGPVRCVEHAPEVGVIICHGKVYAAAAGPLSEAGLLVSQRAAALSRSGTGA
jgi:hypothetical protein